MSGKLLNEEELERLFLAIDERFKSMVEHTNKVTVQLNEKFEAIGEAMASASKAFTELINALRAVEERIDRIEREKESEEYLRGENSWRWFGSMF